MNVKLLLGIVLFVVGLVAAVAGIAGVGQPARGNEPAMIAESDGAASTSQSSSSAVLPWVAGLSLAVGGVLMGLSMGNFKNPRTHAEPGDQVVDPEGHQKMKHV